MVKTTTKFILGILLFLVFTSQSNAQYVLQSTNQPGTGDLWVNKIITDDILPGGNGAATTWDYSAHFVTPNTISEQYVPLTGTTADITFPGANVKCISFFGMTDYFYKNTATNELTYLGFFTSGDEIHITNTQKLLVAPFAYGSTISNVAVTGTGYQNSALSGTITVEADSYGTLIVGGQTLTNVLRLKTEMNFSEDFGGGLVSTISIVRYAWYKSGLRAPFMQICTYDLDGVLGSAHQKYSLVANVTVGVDEIATPAIGVSVFPNPVKSSIEANVTIDQTSDVTIQLVDITGKLAKSENVHYTTGEHHLSMDVSDLPKGIYMLSIQSGNTTREERISITE